MRPLSRGNLVLAFGCARGAKADIYAYTDQAGITHFSNVPNDARYQLLIASPADEAAAAVPSHRSAHSAIEWLAKSTQYDALIDAAARADTVQAALVRAVIVVESGFNPKAVSKKGAVGLMQLQPATARRYGVKDR